MSDVSGRCEAHDLSLGPDGLCVLCRREARASAVAPRVDEPSRTPWLPVFIASAFGVFFVGGLVGAAFLLSGTEEARAEEQRGVPLPPGVIVAPELPGHGEPPSSAPRANGGRAQATPVATSNAQDPKHRVPIEIYSASWCPACRAAKRWMDQNGYRYTDYDVDSDRGAQQRLRQLNPRGSIPVIVVDGRSPPMIGFSAQQLQSMIDAAAARR